MSGSILRSSRLKQFVLIIIIFSLVLQSSGFIGVVLGDVLPRNGPTPATAPVSGQSSALRSQPADVTPPSESTPLTQWVPSGPASDQINYAFYSGSQAEFNAACLGQSSTCIPSIDLTDTSLTSPSDIAMASNDHRFSVTRTPGFPASPQGFYVQGWTGVTDSSSGVGNYWSLLNMWNQGVGCPTGQTTVGCPSGGSGLTAAQLGFLNGPAIRWGQSAGTSVLNPFLYTTSVEGNIVNEVYDKLLAVNPDNSSQTIGWMANAYLLLNPGTTGCPTSYTNAFGTFTVGECVKMVTRGDISWHDIYNCAASDAICLTSHVVTANDVKFSFAAFNSVGGLIGPYAANTIDVVYNPGVLPSAAYGASGGTQGENATETFVFYLHNASPTAVSDLANVPIVPQRLWVTQTAPVQANGVFAPCINLGSASCTVDPTFLGGSTSDPVLNDRFVGSGPFDCASGALGAAGTTYGGGCAFDSSNSPTGQAIPVGGKAILRRFSNGNNNLNVFYSYFRTNAKFEQFLWTAYGLPAPTLASILKAGSSCQSNIGAIGNVNDYVACQHWNSPACLLDSYATAGVANGACAGGTNSQPGEGCPAGSNCYRTIVFWIGEGAWTFDGPLFVPLTGIQATPQTLYEDGSSEGDFTVGSNPSFIVAQGISESTISVVLSGGPDNYMGGGLSPYTANLNTVVSGAVSATVTTPLSNGLSPSTPSGTAILTVTISGTGTVIVRVAITVAAQPTVYRTVTTTTNNYGLVTTLSPNLLVVGSSIADSATLTGGFNVGGSGTVTYYLFLDGTCTGPSTIISTVTLTNGFVQSSGSSGPLNSAGLYSLNAVFSGDANNNMVPSPCEAFTVGSMASPTIASIIKDDFGTPVTSVVTGNPVHDTSTLSGATSTAGGSVTYSIFTNGACSGTPLPGATSVQVTNGVVPDSGNMGTAGLTPGSYGFNAVYSGDLATGNGVAASLCEPFTVVSMTSPTISTVIKSSSGSPVTSVAHGNPVHDTSTLSGDTANAGGHVTYNLYSNGACSGSAMSAMVSVTNGVVQDSGNMGTGGLSLGSYSFDAVYGGDPSTGNGGATSLCEPFTVVNGGSVTIATIVKDSAGAPVTSVLVGGNPVHDTASLSGATNNAGGAVTYNLFTNGACSGTPLRSENDPVSNSVVTDSSNMGTGGLPPGSYSFNSVYGGDPSTGNGGATSLCEPFTIMKATPTIATVLFLNSVITGSSITDSAHLVGVTSNAGGAVTYEYFTGSNCIGPATTVKGVNVLNGVAASSGSRIFNAAGPYSWNAFYSGDPSNAAATSACEPLSVDKAVSSTSTLVENAATNQPPSGSEVAGASFYDTASVKGFVSIATVIKDLSGSPVTFVVMGNPVHDTAILTGVTRTGGGTVTYNLFTNGACSGAAMNSVTFPVTDGVVPDSGGMGTPSLSPGSYTFNATYTGDTSNAGAMSPCESFAVVNSGSVSIATAIKDSSGSPVTSLVVGNPVHDTAILAGATANAGGSVTYNLFSNGACSGTFMNMMSVGVTNGVVPDSGNMGTAGLSPGSYSFNAHYSGDTNGNGGATSSCEPFTVASTAVSGIPPIPTGTLFYNLFANGGCTGTPLTSQSVVLTGSGAVPNSMPTGALSGGLYGYDTMYIGDSNYLASTSACEPFSVQYFSISNSGMITVHQGSSAANVITVTLISGVTEPVTLSAGAFPSGTGFSFAFGCSGTPTCTDSPTFSTTLGVSTLAGAAGTPVGDYIITVIGTGNGGLTQSTTFTLRVVSDQSIGGVLVPVNLLALLAPYTVLTSMIAAATVLVVLVLRRSRQGRKNP